MGYLVQTFNRSTNVAHIRPNVPTLGEEADFKLQTFGLAQKPIESTNVQFSPKTAFLPNVCYALVADF